MTLKTEPDGRMFPVTDRSETVIGCLLDAAREAGVEILTKRAVRDARREGDGFAVTLGDGDPVRCDRLLLTTGGMRGGRPGASSRASVTASSNRSPRSSPSTSTTRGCGPRRSLVPAARVRVTGHKAWTRVGPLLVTHWGLSGPGVLRLSAWGARPLAEVDYTFELQVDWLPELPEAFIASMRRTQARRQVAATRGGRPAASPLAAPGRRRRRARGPHLGRTPPRRGRTPRRPAPRRPLPGHR